MVHRPTDSRLLANLLEQEKSYSKQLGQVIEASNASLTSFAAYAASSAPPASHVIMSVAGVLAAADESMRSYARGVDEWRDAIRALKDAEEEVGNIMRDREILVTRLIKASKPSKNGSGNIRDSLLLGHQQFPSSSSLSLSTGGHADSPSPPPSRPLSSSFSSSTKLAAAQSELQACEAHLAAKERELIAKRNITIRDGLGARIRAMINCGWAWSELGKSALRSLDELRTEQQEQQGSSMQEARSVTNAYNAGLSAPELDSTRPSSDFSSVGPSQSASQVNGFHDLLPPLSMTAVMNHAMLGDLNTQASSSNVQTASHVQRPASHQSSAGSSIFSGPAIPTTYQVETVTYAPATAVHVASKELPNDTKPEFPSIHMPAPHALTGYAYDIPTAANSEAGPSQIDQPHFRSQLDYSSSQQVYSRNSKQTNESGFHPLERRITEDSQEDRLRSTNPSRQDDEVSSFEEVKQEVKLVEEGKLAVVENPRFLTEARKREIEKEKEKARKEEEARAVKEKGKSRVAEDDGHENREKKRFSLFHSSKASRDHPQPARTPTQSEFSTNHDERVSPSKGFLGSLRGIFSTKPLVAASPKTPQHQVDNSNQSDSDTEVSPLKTRNRGLQSLFRNADHSKNESSGRWQTRTDKNIQQLSSRRSYDDIAANESRNNGIATGLSSGNSSQAAVVNAAGVGRRPSTQKAVRGRVASDVGTNAFPHTSANPSSGTKKLQKTRGGRGAGSGVPENVGNASVASLTTPTHQAAPTSARTPVIGTIAKRSNRRSASVDPSENRKSWGEAEGDEGNGMIIDLGRRRVASEVDGPKAEGADAKAPGTNVKKVDATIPRPTRSEIAGRSVDVFGPNKSTKGYSSDTAATLSKVTKKKSLTKKRGDQDSKDSTTSLVTRAPPSQVISPSSSVQPFSTVSQASAPARKNPTKSTPSNNTSTKTPVSQQTGSATVLTAGGEHPSGVLVSQKGWSAQSQVQGGGLSRNSSVVSVTSAPAGGVSKTKKKTTPLGQGVGGASGVARRASLMNGSTSMNAQSSDSGPTSVIQAQPPATSLMSIVEDVARANREGWQQDLKARKSVGGSQKATGMFDVVKAPPLVGRERLGALDAAETRNRVTGSPASTTSTAVPSRTGMFEIKAPGSVFDQQQVITATTPVQQHLSSSRVPVQGQSATQKTVGSTGTALSTASSSRRAAQTPLRSAMRGSRSPSPLAGSSRLPQDRNDDVVHEEHSLPAPVDGMLPWDSDGKLHQPRKDRGKARAPTTPEETDPSGDESEVFYSDLEEVEAKSSSVVTGPVLPPPVQAPLKLDLHKTSLHMMGNGFANGHAKAPSEVSQSSTSTFLAGRLKSESSEHDNTPRRRKSVRVSLQPTFSPSPPAIDYDEEEEQRRHAPWAWQENRRPETNQRNIHEVVPPLAAPIPTHTPKVAITEQLDMWADSDDEDAQYTQAKRLLTRAAKKEKDVSLMVANRGY